MTGTGIQTDPYIVMNYSDLCSMKGGSETYYKLGADIDFSQTERNPDSEAIEVSFKELDGNGHILKNYFRREVVSDTVSSMFINTSETALTFRNIKILDTYFVGGTVQLIQSDTITSFYNSQIGIKFINNQSKADNPEALIGRAYIQDCEVIAEGTSSYVKPLIYWKEGNQFVGSLVKIDINVTAPLSDVQQVLFGHTVFLSGFIGKLTSPNPSHIKIILANLKSSCSYFAIDIDGTTNKIEMANFEGVNFYDKEVMSKVVDYMPVADNFKALETVQCKDRDYLNSIGFPCNKGDVI